MKMKKLTYLFAICPAVVALASCNKASTPANSIKELPYAEAKAYVVENFDNKIDLRTDLAKSAKVTFSTSGIKLDGLVCSQASSTDPTVANVNFSLPAQKNMTFDLLNSSAATNAAFIQYFLSGERNSSNAIVAGGRKAMILEMPQLLALNPFLTSTAVDYLHSFASAVSELNLLTELYAIDEADGTFHFAFAINDLKTFTEKVEEQEWLQHESYLTVFRGNDGHVALDLGFTPLGYLKSVSIDAQSNHLKLCNIDINGAAPVSDSVLPLYEGVANLNVQIDIEHELYADTDYHSISVYDADAGLKVGRQLDKKKNERLNSDGGFYYNVINYFSDSIFADSFGCRRTFSDELIDDAYNNQIFHKYLSKYASMSLPGYGANVIVDDVVHYDEDKGVDVIIDIDKSTIEFASGGKPVPLKYFLQDQSVLMNAPDLQKAVFNTVYIDYCYYREYDEDKVILSFAPKLADYFGDYIVNLVTREVLR